MDELIHKYGIIQIVDGKEHFMVKDEKGNGFLMFDNMEKAHVHAVNNYYNWIIFMVVGD